MTIPTYLNTNIRYKRDATVTDVQTIINSIVAEAQAITPAWSNPLSGKIVSPADADGRQVTVQFNKISATVLEMVVTDGQGRSVTKRANIAVAGSNIDYFTGPYSFYIDWFNADNSNSEGHYVSLLDLSPELQTAHNKWVVMHGSRLSGGTFQDWNVGHPAFVNSTGAFGVVAGSYLYPFGNNRTINNGGIGGGKLATRTPAGSNYWYPVIQIGDPVSAGVYRIYGKWFQALLCNSGIFAAGSEVSVPVDESTTGVFRVLQIQINAADKVALAARKS